MESKLLRKFHLRRLNCFERKKIYSQNKNLSIVDLSEMVTHYSFILSQLVNVELILNQQEGNLYVRISIEVTIFVYLPLENYPGTFGLRGTFGLLPGQIIFPHTGDGNDYFPNSFQTIFPFLPR